MKYSLAERWNASRLPVPWDKTIVMGPEDGDLVVLLHGVWGSPAAMCELQCALDAEGFETMNVSYPSFRRELDVLATELGELVAERADEGQEVHFVTHSLGGIVLRELSDDERDWVLGKVVMLAPPNAGSEVVDLAQLLRLNWVLGPAGRFLATAEVPRLPRLEEAQQLVIVMGNKPERLFFHWLLEGDHDDTVTVEGGRLGSGEEFVTVASSHTLIMVDDEVTEGVVRVMKGGSWSTEVLEHVK